MIAKVIVDVPTNQTDRLFDYLIPPSFEDSVQPGIRVVVPFGPRKVQGFIMELATTTDFDVNKLKYIEELIDVEPQLTDELLILSKWLKETTLSFHISVLKTMLPAAMRAKYKKEVFLNNEVKLSEMDDRLKEIFQNGEAVFDLDVLLKQLSDDDRRLLFKAYKKKDVVVHPVVGTKETKKKRMVVKRQVSIETLKNELHNIPKNATKQKKLIEFFIDYDEPITIVELEKKLNTTRQSIQSLVNKGLLLQKEIEIRRDPYEGRTFKKTTPLPLTDEQKQAMEPILQAIEQEKHETFLLHGVTGSGKTEIYLQSIDRVLSKGKEAIVLVPEISLTPQMVTRFKERFGEDVAVMHSALSTGEKYDEWRRIKNKRVKVAVGARSAIFAPFENIGMIIIDEEHETSYKQEEAPRYHARDVAIQRGKYYNCPVILGSATPSLESYARAKKGIYKLLEMKHRVNNIQMPIVTVTDMRKELHRGNRSMFSELLLEKMQDRLEKKEQIVLLLNRRGYSTFILCRDCGYVVQCPHCDISLTYHRSNHTMQCHYCGYVETPPTNCPKCESDAIRFFGTGTQKVEEELYRVLPGVRVIRMDVDTTRRKGSHERLLTKFGNGEGDILLGTQMIAKGLDFPNITLVGVLAADSMLHIPDFRSSERTFQLLTQVSGRAGRHKKKGEVIIQTYTPEHYSIVDVKQHDYESFFNKEMRIRKKTGYPPYYYLTLIHVSDIDIMNVVKTTEKICRYLRSTLSENTIIYGPVASSIPRIKDRYRYQCMIKYKVEPALTEALKEILDTYQGEMSRTGLMITVDMNPFMMM